MSAQMISRRDLLRKLRPALAACGYSCFRVDTALAGRWGKTVKCIRHYKSGYRELPDLLVLDLLRLLGTLGVKVRYQDVAGMQFESKPTAWLKQLKPLVTRTVAKTTAPAMEETDERKSDPGQA